jgi:excisionase family DNA binding protein
MRTMITIHTANDTSYLTVKEAAEELGINMQTIRDYLAKGVIKTYKFKTLTLISVKEIEAWKKNRLEQ